MAGSSGPNPTTGTSGPTSGQTAREGPEAQAALVARLRAGEASAFEDLVRTHGGRMLAVALRMMGSEHDAHDAVQDAFLSAFKSLDRFDGRSLLSTWLHRITVNACLMKMRTRRRRPERAIEDLLPEFAADGHQSRPSRDWKRDAWTGIEGEETRAIVREKIEELPEAFRVVLVLRDIEGLDTADAAQVLGITPNAVKVRLHRARQALRTLLDPYFAEGTP